ncbi:hypothetical protein PY310_15530 [Pseudarthrobacter sp. H3Y2-7]|uniref:hypothetical protein n=1 Tax=Pseudarthrobacter naphthalenicus TaxID=3031328 RepID=UPI0023AFD71F|nr:hypothetical protein [Pseudarthrobacter sp. H3Y2-7]MDE8669992.1 hypothetical protein [Pseudarthrobacter sp. H3Y2-7]
MTAENTTPEDLQRAAGPTPGPAGMPLGGRRLLMIGGLCIPVGLVAGPYLLPAQLLTVVGIVLLAVALSYRAGKRWFSRWSLAVTVAGALWLAATAAYHATIMIAADAAAPLPGVAQVLFNTGAVFFAAMAVTTITAVVMRMLANRRGSRDEVVSSLP